MKIGFIDYYLDEWHANNYPQGLRDASNGEIEVAYAYAMTDSPKEDGLTTAEWCKKYGVTQCNTVEELVEKSDATIVLSPDNFEYHEQLARIPLKSGKPCYIDKTFAPDKATAERIFALANKHGTPCFSTSALRYAKEYADIDTEDIVAITANGPAKGANIGLDIYLVHILEPIMMLMKDSPERIMFNTAKDRFFSLTIKFKDGRLAIANGFANSCPYTMTVANASATKKHITVQSKFFDTMYVELAKFLKTGIAPVDSKVTINIMAVREKTVQALSTPGVWIEL